jgi:hypothetical protein
MEPFMEPIIPYLVSSRQIETTPKTFFVDWLEAIRTSNDQTLQGASVVVRPHPTEVGPWLGRMIDAAIFGKPVCTLELPEFAFGKRGTVLFEYLLGPKGLLRTARNLDEHVATLAGSIDHDPYERDELSSRFVERFVRPHGERVIPAAVFAEEMMGLLAEPSGVHPPGPVGRRVGRILHWAAPALGVPLEPDPYRRRSRKAVKQIRKSRKRLRLRVHASRKSLRSRPARTVAVVRERQTLNPERSPVSLTGVDRPS